MGHRNLDKQCRFFEIICYFESQRTLIEQQTQYYHVYGHEKHKKMDGEDRMKWPLKITDLTGAEAAKI